MVKVRLPSSNHGTVALSAKLKINHVQGLDVFRRNDSRSRSHERLENPKPACFFVSVRLKPFLSLYGEEWPQTDRPNYEHVRESHRLRPSPLALPLPRSSALPSLGIRTLK